MASMSDADQQHSDSPASVAIITVSYGSRDALRTFLSTLHAVQRSAVPVVVVDNKPDADGVRALAEEFGAVYVPRAENPGYGAGMNAGVAAIESRADAFFFCNPDLSFTEDVIPLLASELTSDPRVGSIGPALINEDGSIYPSARNIPSVGTGVGHALFAKVWPGNPWTTAYQNARKSGSPRSAGSLSGAAVMVRSDVYAEVQGWDEDYFMHFEDVDLGFRIGRLGYENRYEPRVSVVHSGAHSTKKHAVVVERAMTASAMRFMHKRYPGARYAPLRWVIDAGLRVRGAARVFRAKREEGRA